MTDHTCGYEVTVQDYRNVFVKSTNGQKVLRHIVTELGFFDAIPADAAQVALRNYAIKLLGNCGLMADDTLVRQKIIEALTEVPVEQIMNMKSGENQDE